MRYSVKWTAALLTVALLLSGCTGTSINHPPAIGAWGPRGDPILPEEAALVFWVNASDSDGQALTCRWFVDGNLSHSSGSPFVFSYMPGRADGVHAVKAVVSDGSLAAQRSWKVTVVAVNHPPGIVSEPAVGDQTVNEGGSLRFTADATDPDGDPVSLRWTLDGRPVAENRSAFLYEPDFTMAGAHVIRLLASDGNRNSQVAWNVTVVDVNRAPRLDSWSPQSDIHLVELGSVGFCVTASDEDGDAVAYRWSVDGAPAGEGPVFNYITGFFSAGNRTVTVTASDGGLSDSHSWAVRVDNQNRPPRIATFDPPGDAAATEYGTVAFSLGGADDDGDALSVSWFVDGGALPAGAGPRFNYTPGYDSTGNRTVTAVLSDGSDTIGRSWNVTVSRAVADWTVLVYMNADDDLEPYLVEDFNEMELCGSTERVNIVVQMDRHPSYDTSSGDWNGTRRYLVGRDTDQRVIRSLLLEDPGEMNMGAEKTLSDFLLWGLEKFPARRFQVVLSGHGDGWQGISQDFSDQNDRLSLSELAGALGAFADRRGAPVDVLLLDVCYWAMLETGWSLRDRATYIVASEDIDPSAGQRYDLALAGLVKDPLLEPRALAADLVEAFRECYAAGGYYPQDSETFTQSAVETARLEALAGALDGLSSVLAGNMTVLAPSVSAARNAVETYGKPDYVDLYEFVRQIRARSANNALNETADAALGAINATVAANAAGTLRPHSAGVSIYFPVRSSSYNAAYAALPFSLAHGWDGMLKEYYNVTGRSAGGRGGVEVPPCPLPEGPAGVPMPDSKMLDVRAGLVRLTFQGGS